MNKKIAAKDLKPGMQILYRGKWYQFGSFSAEDKQIMFRSDDGEILTKMIFPSLLVTVKPGDVVRESKRVGKGTGFYYSHEKCWAKEHPTFAHVLNMCGHVVMRSGKAELMSKAELASNPGCAYCDAPLK